MSFYTNNLIKIKYKKYTINLNIEIGVLKIIHVKNYYGFINDIVYSIRHIKF